MPGRAYSGDYAWFLSKLKQAREAAGLTQRQAAAMLGKPQSYVSKSETGERRVDVVELVGFARIYNEPLSYFVSQHDTSEWSKDA